VGEPRPRPGPAPERSAAPEPAARSPEKALTILLTGRRFALGLEQVWGVGPPRDVRFVPGAPDTVAGLTEWRGSILTVLDLPRILGVGRAGDRPWLVRLAPPFEHVALACPALPAIASGEGSTPLEPASLVERATPRTPPRER
jgi:hypothetical protein